MTPTVAPTRPSPQNPSDARPAYTFRGRPLTILRGHTLPLGAIRAVDGYNFVLVCRGGTAVTLVLADLETRRIEAEIPLDPAHHRFGYHWHVRVAGLEDGIFCYGFRVDGPKGPRHAYDPSIVLLDPSSRATTGGRPWGQPDGHPRMTVPTAAVRGRPVPEDAPPPPRIAREDSILYELHVRGYTVDPSSGVAHPGTFAGLAEKIAYLKDLGVTGVELLPVAEFDEMDCPFVNPLTGEPLHNFWGYNTICYSAPKASYATDHSGAAPWEEFGRMVRAFHAEGLEVVLDVVFNHTAEGGKGGPTYHFRGIDNNLYYLVDDEGRYFNFSGCGNTVNSNDPIVRGLILTTLRNWAAETEIDGLRFDLASVFGRDHKGHVLVEPPVVELITADPLLADAKLIAEPWDAAGLYQVESFPGGSRWSVWNGRYRDDVRKFWKGDFGLVPAFATRLCGSSDMFHDKGPLYSLNFITCHDGFTLNDLVSYNHKHNEANGEGNRDGCDHNESWNCGVEGPTDDPGVLALRARQARNFLATLMVSQGVPMLLGGDEFLRTQGGNNNAWCQDGPTSWVDWTLAERNVDFHRFVRLAIALRKRHPVLRRRTFFRGKAVTPPDIIWHGVEPGRPDWSGGSRAIACCLDGRGSDREGVYDRDLYLAFNAHCEPLTFRIPAAPTGRRWRLAIDTAKPSPEDIHEPDAGPIVPVMHPYRVEGRSMIVLVSEPGPVSKGS